MKREPIAAAELLIGVALIGVFVLLRLPLFSESGLILGWNSDAALFGLMARSVAEGWDVPLFFWGQSYLGTITALLTAAVATLMGEVGPFALRISVAMMILVAACFFWLALRRVVGRPAAMLATAWLVAGPSFVFFAVIATPGSVEQLLLLSALLFWFVTRAELARNVEWLIVGLLCGVGMWVHQGIVFLILGIAVAVLREKRLSVRAIGWGALGAAIGYSPAMVWWLGDHPILYRRTLAPWHPLLVWENLTSTLASDLWLLLADDSALGIAAGMVILAFSAIAIRRLAWSRGQLVMVVTIATGLAFWIFSNYPSPGAVRYLAPAVPLLYGFAAAGVAAWYASDGARRALAVGAAIFVTAALYIPRHAEARDVEAGKAEQYENWPSKFAPRPVLEQLRAGGYRVCYGEAWVAHKLEWISKPTVRFVPVRIVHRTLPQSLALIRKPGPKCFVENDGTVRRLTAAEEAQWRESVIVRARKAGLLGNVTR